MEPVPMVWSTTIPSLWNCCVNEKALT